MGAIVLEVAFNIEDVVYLKSDPDRLPRIVIKYIVDKYHIIYELAIGERASGHYDFEITRDLKECLVI